ncbi:GyrI-like domain-containing protein [Fictibacillus sp. BK138]|uniref:GyrI-like domain-containing protein n=1 Tax=Fictibacillus sp. BK138 TaxID=2512121 RepID=UPI001029D9E4|nr:effector binding domain-containing protein [Fictibacillus sp. BK138]RZT23667.1 putative transcriptional regulator YdeE [Fictibacillus sp. BK138]
MNRRINKVFQVVGMKNKGIYSNFGSEVPKNAQRFMSRIDEIKNHLGIEVSLFEPKKGEDHKEGQYYVGVLVKDKTDEVPSGMEYIEISGEFVSTRGSMTVVSDLYNSLQKWSEEHGYYPTQQSYFIEMYHQVEEGEEVEIYLPIIINNVISKENQKVT